LRSLLLIDKIDATAASVMGIPYHGSFFLFLIKKLQNKSHESVYYGNMETLGPIHGPWPNFKPIG